MANEGLCCCCLEQTSPKTLWSLYTWRGTTEVYGEMLKECFSLTIPKQKNSEKDQICEVCIVRLRSAIKFKKQVEICQAKLHSQLDTDVFKEIEEKIRRDDVRGRIVKILRPPSKVKSKPVGTVGVKSVSKLVNKRSASKSIMIRPIKINKHKQILIKVNSNKVKKDFSEDFEATLTSMKEDLKKDKMELFHIEQKAKSWRENAWLLLENSTLCPFKIIRGSFSCFYCATKCFVTFDELKLHVKELHEKVTLKIISKSLARRHNNEKIKVDVSEIGCKVCFKEFDCVDDLVKHLSDEHLVQFNYELKPSDSFVMYELKDGQFKCPECKKEFLYFKTLCEHLNVHSTDNVCDICGQCFVFAGRLYSHRKTHSKTAFNCRICNKLVFCKNSLHAHMRNVHRKPKLNCTVCNESFDTVESRMNHYVEIHGRSRPEIKCDICGREYTKMSMLNRHIKHDHLNVPKQRNFVCAYCEKCFVSSSSLSNHMLVHTKERKHECEVCRKVYPRKKSLREHMKIHNNDRRWSCAACSQDFVQKCSLRSHIRVHHPDLDCEKQIVYTKPEK